MACDGCTDVCNCVVQSGENVTVTGSGSLLDPYVVNAAFTETVFAATSPGGTLDITPGGTAGHEPELDVDVCAILDVGSVETTGQLFVVSPDVDCKPHVLVNPGPGQVLGEVGGEAGWIDPAAAAIPVGSVLFWPGDTAPVWALEMDGSLVDVATYPVLFSIFGYDYGGAGPQFALPSGSGRVLVGVGTHADVAAVGDNDGLALANRRVWHPHTVDAHDHSFADTSSGPSNINTGGAAGYTSGDWNAVTDPHNGAGNRTTLVGIPTTGHTHNVAGTTGTDSPDTDDNGPAYLTLLPIIVAG